MPEPIVVVPYNPIWQEWFLETAQPMRETLGDVALRIDHIGSTAIVGLDAKPIIDIQISVGSFESFNRIRLPLESMGYYWRSDNPDISKRYFRESGVMRRTHIHVRRSGSWSEQLALLFRDYLRAHYDDALAYADLKHQLAQQYRNDRDGYVQAKAPFIWQILQKADTWSQITGWQVEESDA